MLRVRSDTSVGSRTRRGLIFRRHRTVRSTVSHGNNACEGSTKGGNPVALLPRMRLTARLLTIVVCISILSLDAAAQERAAPDKTLSPYFFVEGGDPDVDGL